MRTGLSCCLLVALHLGSAAGGALAAPRLGPDIHFIGDHGRLQRGVRCGVPAPEPAQQAWVEDELAAVTHAMVPGAASTATVTIPVVWHVIHEGARGDLPRSAIDDQIAVLNRSYGAHGYQFRLASVERTEDPDWWTVANLSRAERDMKRALAVSPANYLNVYSANPQDGVLGWATLPWTHTEDSFMHGVVILHSTVPGGSAAPYNEGDTLTHEAGHYLGLYHTFQGGCGDLGDRVDDTPAEESAAFGCPVGRDTCPGGGADPVNNFMDYVDDACMERFTPDQKLRIDAMLTAFKPDLLD
ncbi:MAG: zinc metalloprotease [Candidatus Schekmanbacteria bacterium]|nr:zinc metalloprotease [Candidatus Schekmanbacteria bacterium]